MAIYANAVYPERQLVASADGGAAFDTAIDCVIRQRPAASP
jgi:hypothetical protein